MMDKEFLDNESPEDVRVPRRESIKDAAGYIQGELFQLMEYIKKDQLPAARSSFREILSWCKAIENDLKL